MPAVMHHANAVQGPKPRALAAVIQAEMRDIRGRNPVDMTRYRRIQGPKPRQCPHKGGPTAAVGGSGRRSGGI
ncbi:hypothetical protein GCM10011505_37700 [Tistrella bauzanensis]|uniref:Uncharacterized protein n=1 Tax=Tistrella bauzanensis TaxID=657419 RepID=A0ABQ1IY12_9PROT|nr:hypothetical protein GCM10011505_37700 [Tistrella bauzanensis]